MPSSTSSTICALATPAGGALGIIRVSGPEAITLTGRIFRPASAKLKSLSKATASTTHFGRITTPSTGEIIDEVMVTIARAPHSYTGEDTAEITCHGSAYIMSTILTLLQAEGCRLAEPGEYTKRAFLNGKLDLTQAEAVADLIASRAAADHRLAMQQLRGGVSQSLKELRKRLTNLAALLELELDFSEHEDLEFASRPQLLAVTHEATDRLSELCATFRLGNALRRGIPLALVGEANAGKSTLLNALIGDDRALVSDIAGTTRDTVEATLTLADGTLLRLVDTAGLRTTTDRIEQMGIERSLREIERAEILLWVIDATNFEAQYNRLVSQTHSSSSLAETTTIIVANKSDLLTAEERAALSQHLATFSANLDPAHPAVASKRTGLLISAYLPEDIQRLKQTISNAVSGLRAAADKTSDVIVSNARHHECLSLALAALQRVEAGLSCDNLPVDLLAQDLREALTHLGEVTGEVTTSDVLKTIFSKFCIGK